MTSLIESWNAFLGETLQSALVQTTDGGFALVGTQSIGLGNGDF
jgi:hypothetical protein